MTGCLIRLTCFVVMLAALRALLLSPAFRLGEDRRLLLVAAMSMVFTFAATSDLWRAVYRLRRQVQPTTRRP